MGVKTDRATGKLKEAGGKVTRNRELWRKGRDEQAKGDLKQSAEKAKDAIKKSSS